MSKSLQSVQTQSEYAKSSLVSERKSTMLKQNSSVDKLTKELYQTAQQVKYLHLQAEVEFLLQQQQTLKRQRLASASKDGQN